MGHEFQKNVASSFFFLLAPWVLLLLLCNPQPAFHDPRPLPARSNYPYLSSSMPNPLVQLLRFARSGRGAVESAPVHPRRVGGGGSGSVASGRCVKQKMPRLHNLFLVLLCLNCFYFFLWVFQPNHSTTIHTTHPGKNGELRSFLAHEELNAAKSLLRMTCDAVVELGEDLCVWAGTFRVGHDWGQPGTEADPSEV